MHKVHSVIRGNSKQGKTMGTKISLYQNTLGFRTGHNGFLIYVFGVQGIK